VWGLEGACPLKLIYLVPEDYNLKKKLRYIIMFIAAIEGNIGSGKSTVIDLLKKNMNNYSVFAEDVDNWVKEGILGKFYHNMKEYASSFQLRTQISHIENGKRFGDRNIVERSPISNHYIFGELLHADGFLNDVELEMIDRVNQLIGWKPNVVFVLLCHPEVCVERIRRRNREDEKIPGLEYIQLLHKKHLELQERLKNDGYNTEVIYVDTTYKTPQEVFDEINNYLSKL
jgi:deoxyadenosine/deoxycytidine kinase